jgi:hypothetical protein
MCAVPSAPEAAGGRVWEAMSRGRGHEWGARRRRALGVAYPLEVTA